MPSGEEIQHALRSFVDRWATYAGSEKSEAQTFLNQLFGCYGSDRREVGAEFEFYVPTTGGFMDLHWPGIALIEMKAPTVPVATAQQQVERYWRASSDRTAGRPAARWIVICNFRDLAIWEYGRYPDAPVAEFPLTELPDRYDALAFLAGPTVEPSFTEHYRELTKEAAKVVAEVFTSLVDRSAAPPNELQRFILQSVWCMFAEDLTMLDGYPFQATLNLVVDDPGRSAAELGHLFRVLNQKGSHNRTGRLAGTQYVNGDLFAQPAEVGLNRSEVELLLRATAFDWRKVNPTIFGSLLEGVLGRERRWELGAHYTHEVDIMKIVTPTIIRPWRERLDAATTPAQARALLDELCTFRVLDPACGCGNFLYVAYRELRALEWELKQRIGHLAAETGLPVPAGPLPYYPLHNLQGIDIESRAVMITRVTLWMGHRQMIDLYGDAEPALPLQDLSSIRQADALRVPWPETDCIIGNPPFLGDRHLRGNFGDDYVEWLKREFGVGVKDFCVYWFRRAADHLRAGQRAGLVGTNSISQNRARSASLEYIVDGGGVIVDAVSSQKWPGDAKVHVSLVNWIASPVEAPTDAILDGVRVDGITPSLTGGTSDGWAPKPIASNRGKAFYGPVPIGSGFQLSEGEAATLRAMPEADYRQVVWPYLTGADIVDRPDQSPSRWTIDFGSMPLEDARRYPSALSIVRERVKPIRDTNNRESYRRRWWQFGEPCLEMRAAIAPMRRFVIGLSTGKRAAFAWASDVTMNNSTVVFAFDDDYSMGVLLSRTHRAWAWAQSSTLETRLRYTPSSVFETFAWPDPVAEVQRGGVSEACRRLLARRAEICTTENIGLTKLYNAVDDGAWTDLKALHRDLDVAVADCYGWPAAVAQDDREIVRRLTELNREIIEGGREYAPFEPR